MKEGRESERIDYLIRPSRAQRASASGLKIYSLVAHAIKSKFNEGKHKEPSSECECVTDRAKVVAPG